ncbi:MAG: ABC transporter ATP-binding protein [Desulfatibacillaceae bacterium]|nr:ABC transporter ATP-binding protein [Desulfatibacillaceae bacterium]
MTAPALIFEDVSYFYADKTRGLDRVGFSVMPGECIALCGRNGSGKSTLLRHANGLARPSSGRVMVFGVCTKKDAVFARLAVGMVFADSSAQIVEERVYEDVAFGPENLNLPRPEVKRRVEKALDWTGLAPLAAKRTENLSSGEKRRLAIAGVLAMEPRVIVLDEPFSNLDWPGKTALLDELLRLKDLGTTLIVATHDVELVQGLCSRILIMDKGALIRDGGLAEFAAESQSLGLRPWGQTSRV